MSELGVIGQRSVFYLPATLPALLDDANFGPTGLQMVVDLLKQSILGDIVSADAEVSTYTPLVQDYLARRTAVSIIPKAIDYWGDQQVSVSATGTAESVSYPERREQLWTIRRNLLLGLRRQKLELVDGTWTLVTGADGDPGAPVVSFEHPNFKTPDPDGWPALRTKRALADLLPWRIS